MTGILAAIIVLYCAPFARMPLLVSIVPAFLFPMQIVFWRLTYGRKLKDFLFCFSILTLILILKHYWQYSDILFYVFAIIIGAVVHYWTFGLLTLSLFAMELLREFFYRVENPQDIALRYVLFFAAGSLTHVLLRQEQRLKEDYKKELDDLRYGIDQVEKAPLAMMSDDGQISRKVDAAIALDHSLQNTLQLIHNIFKPETTLLWQYLPEKQQLRIRNQLGNVQNLKSNFSLVLGEGPIGWAALNRKSFTQQLENARTKLPYYRKSEETASLIAVPIVQEERLEGVISLDSAAIGQFPKETESALWSFAGQMSETIRMARLAQEREERAFEFQAFYHGSKELASMIDFEEIIHTLHALSSQIVKSEFAAIAIVQDDEERYVSYEWNFGSAAPEVHADLLHGGQSWISWFLQNREEPLIISETQLHLQEMCLIRREEDFGKLTTYLAVPLRHQQRSMGALLLASHQKEAFSSHQARILSILCNQAAVSLENSSIIKKMEVLAITDGLTGLHNHRYFQDSLEREIARAERQKQSLSLLLLDIDHFKSFNDSFGHPAGDFALKSLAALLKSNARKIDILARYGGEEFAALLPGIDVKNARKTAERWRKAVQRGTLKWEDKSFAITLSIGFAAYPSDAKNKTELIDKADRALYYAKENGRNQARHFSETERNKSSLF